jgi:hypothetical protein
MLPIVYVPVAAAGYVYRGAQAYTAVSCVLHCCCVSAHVLAAYVLPAALLVALRCCREERIEASGPLGSAVTANPYLDQVGSSCSSSSKSPNGEGNHT